MGYADASALDYRVMKAKVVAILETRTGEHLGEMIARRGGTPLLAPALEEVPDVDPQVVADVLKGWPDDPYRVVIFQTGVGTRALFAATDALSATDLLLRGLAEATVVVRGPKPTGELTARGVRIDLRAGSPFTTETILEALSRLPLEAVRVLVQRYGATNQSLCAALQARGARVREIATYRWALPADTRPLTRLLDALAESRVDAVVFTSAVQAENLRAVAAAEGRAQSLALWLNRTVVASIGPVCSRMLRSLGVVPTVEADPPKLGPLIAALETALRAP